MTCAWAAVTVAVVVVAAVAAARKRGSWHLDLLRST